MPRVVKTTAGCVGRPRPHARRCERLVGDVYPLSMIQTTCFLKLVVRWLE